MEKPILLSTETVKAILDGRKTRTRRVLKDWQKEVDGKGHTDWCGRPCSECMKPCKLDENMPCSPDCVGIDHSTGKPAFGVLCEGCDAGEAWKELYGKEEE